MFNNTTQALVLDETVVPEEPVNVLGHTLNVVPIILVMGVLAGIGNFGTLTAFVKDPNVCSKPSDFILLSLVCADIGISVMIIPRVALVKTLGYWPFGEIGCRTLSILVDFTCSNAAIYSVILLSWDRYQMLTLDYSEFLRRHTKKYIAKAIGITWMVASLRGIIENIAWSPILESLPYHLDFNLICVPPSLLTLTGTIVSLLLSLIPVAFVGVFGINIVLQLQIRLKKWQRVGSVSDHQPSSSHNENPVATGTTNTPNTTSSSNNGNSVVAGEQQKSGNDNSVALFRKRYLKPIITYMMLVLALLVCNIPVYMFVLVMNVCPLCRNINSKATLNYLTLLVYFNSCLNPILYALTNARIRGFYAKYIKRLIHVWQN